MDGRVNGRSDQNTSGGTVTMTEGSLDKPMPINLFGWTHYKQEKQSNDKRRKLGFVKIDAGDFFRSKWKDGCQPLLPKDWGLSKRTNTPAPCSTRRRIGLTDAGRGVFHSLLVRKHRTYLKKLARQKMPGAPQPGSVVRGWLKFIRCHNKYLGVSNVYAFDGILPAQFILQFQ